MMNENKVREALEKMGYSLKSMKLPISETNDGTRFNTMYSVVDSDNVVVSGELPLSLNEVIEKWLSKTYDQG